MISHEKTGPDWVPTLLALEPGLATALGRAGIRDEATYQDREGALPRRIRGRVASARLDLTLLARAPLADLARSSPPWVREAPLSALLLPHPVLSRLSRIEARRVTDLERASGPDLGPSDERVIRIALYRAIRSEPPRPAPRPAPPPDHVRSLLDGAPPELLLLPISALPGASARLIRATRRGGIETVRDLLDWTDANLKLLPFFGQKSMADLRLALAALLDAYPAPPAGEDEPEPTP